MLKLALSFVPTQRLFSFSPYMRMILLGAVVTLLLAISTGGVGGQTIEDDHGDTISTATSLSLGSSVEGRIEPGNDLDVFRLDLSRASSDTDVWIYTSGDLDTTGELLTNAGDLMVSNDDSLIQGRWGAFAIRRILSPGVYYVRVASQRMEPGEYTLHAQAVTDSAGDSIVEAARLTFDSPTPETISSVSEADYYTFDLAKSEDLGIYATGLDLSNQDGPLPLAPVVVEVLDSQGTEIPVNVGKFGFGVLVADDFHPGTYYIRVITPEQSEYFQGFESSYPVPYTILAYEDTRYTKFLDSCEAESRALSASQISDRLYGCQWHLNNREGEDINVETVWEEGITGKGVGVAVVDDGMDHRHEDLRDNVDETLNHDYSGRGDLHHPYQHHGTNVAGVIVARDNAVGVRGVAPSATVYGYNFLGNGSDLNLADAMSRNREVTAVSNNSWGYTGDVALVPKIWELAVQSGLSEGHDGKGIFYAFAAGNGHSYGKDMNSEETNNYYGVTAVCAVSDYDTRSPYSATGAALWICAPSNGGSRGIVTTENSDRYNPGFGGTSAASPIVSGVAALMRETNPELTWRDLKLIVAASARKNDASNPGWEDGAIKYGAESDADRYHFNHEYGFGMVDAEAAVDLAREWSSLPPFESSTEESDELNLLVPDPPAAGEPSTVESTLTMSTSISFVEFVEINVTFNHDSFRDLDIELVSPSDAVSELVGHFHTYENFGENVPLHGTFRLGSARHLGEDPNGEWKLRVTDRIANNIGTLDSWTLTIYGHSGVPGRPKVDWITAGDGSLNIGWVAPRQTGGAPVTTYDLRYIPASADANWTVAADIWNTGAGGPLHHDITGLVVGTLYDVQIRATNEIGAGRWSESFTATASPSPCDTEGAVEDASNNPGLVSDCRVLLEARNALVDSGNLNWSVESPISTWEGVTVGRTQKRIDKLSLQDKGLAGTVATQLGNLVNLTELNLSGNALTGEIPSELTRLTSLTLLSLDDNDLVGQIPESLGNLVDLTKLDLSQNRLSGEIPEGMRRLTNLTYLSLHSNELSGGIPTWLAHLSKLSSLFLAENSFTGCIPEELHDLEVHDLDQLSIPYCGRSVLVAVYNSTGGPNWKNNTNWLSDEPISEWYGVRVNSQGNVTQLLLADNNLTGQMPSELGSLSSLQALGLGGNQLTGEIPTELGSLSNLQSLSLWGNQLTGEIPGWLGSLSNLRSLILGRNQLTGEIPTELGSLSNLRSLSLWGNQLTGEIPGWLGSLSNLQSLDLAGNELTGEIPTELGSLSNLQSLSLGRNQLTGEIPGWLGSLSNLQSLSLAGNELTGEIPTELGSLSNLQSLSLGGNQLTGEIPGWLGSLSSLQRLSLWGNELTGEIPKELENLSDLQSLSLFYNQLTGEIPGWLGSLSNLQRLDLAGNELTGEIPTELGSLSNLRSLSLWGNQLTGEIPPELGSLPNLESLNLQRNQLTGQIPPELGNLSNLQSLYLGDNQLTGCIPPALRDVPNNDLDRLSLPFCSTSLPKAPTIGTVTPGLASLAVSWSAPSSDDSSAITAYDLRYIETAADETKDSNWTLLEDVWTTGSGDFQYTLTGLTGGSSYDLEVRAVNAGGDGPWSETATGTPTTITDHEILTALHNATGGDDWTDNTSWLSDEPLGDWYGVTTDTDGRVTKLDLTKNRLSGRMPSQLGDLSSLSELRLGNNHLSGPIPSELGKLSVLTRLDLENNDLSGPIPSQLGGLADLRVLLLGDNNLDGHLPAQLGNLGKLSYLRIRNNDLTGPIPPEFGSLKNLTHLYANDNDLVGSIPAELGNLSNLRYLFLNDNDLSGSIPAALGQLDKLVYLWLNHNDLSGPIPGELGGLPNLVRLYVNHNNLSGAIPRGLGGLDKLELLYVHRNNLSGAIPRELGSLANLKRLYAYDNDLSGAIPIKLGRLANLERLHIAENDLSGSIPSELGEMSSLSHLILSLNDLTGGIPPSLGRLSNLQVLSLSNNELSGAIPAELGDLSALIQLYIGNNYLEGCIPTKLRDVPSNDLDSLGLTDC